MKARIAALTALGWLAGSGAAHAQLNQAIQVGQNATAQGAQAQQQINDIDDDADALAREYRAVLNQIENVALVVDQQKVFLQSQQNEIDSLNEQISRVEEVENELLPMMLQMVDQLERFIEADMPFLLGDRRDRITKLRDVIDDPDETPAERYRQIINAYEIEESYGRQVTALDEKLIVNGQEIDAEMLRIGRVSLIYRSYGDNSLGIWDHAAKQWRPLPSGYGLDVQKALRIAKELTTPDVFMAPVFGSTQAG